MDKAEDLEVRGTAESVILAAKNLEINPPPRHSHYPRVKPLKIGTGMDQDATDCFRIVLQKKHQIADTDFGPRPKSVIRFGRLGLKRGQYGMQVIFPLCLELGDKRLGL